MADDTLQVVYRQLGVVLSQIVLSVPTAASSRMRFSLALS
jgi:hypothetical protein